MRLHGAASHKTDIFLCIELFGIARFGSRQCHSGKYWNTVNAMVGRVAVGERYERRKRYVKQRLKRVTEGRNRLVGWSGWQGMRKEGRRRE
jgi:hypothetical protein